MSSQTPAGPELVSRGLSRRAFAGLLGGTPAAIFAACALKPPAHSTPGGGIDLSTKRYRATFSWGINQRTEALAAAWNARYPNIQLEPVDRLAPGQGIAGVEKFLAAVAGDAAPDIVYFDRFHVASFAHRGAFHPLDDLIKRDKYDLGRFMKATVDEGYGIDGKLYAIPTGTDNRVLWWNREIFEESGLDPDKPPQDWAQLKEYSVRLTKREGGQLVRAGFWPTKGPAWLYIWGWLNGGEFLSKDARKATLNDPRNVQALEYIVELYDVLGGFEAYEAFRRTHGSREQDPFHIGQIAIRLDGSWKIGDWARYAPQRRFAIGPNPPARAGMPTLTWSGGWSWIIPRNPREPEIAWALIKWLVSEEGFLIGEEAAAAEARSMGQLYVFGGSSTAQLAIDKVLLERYPSGIPEIDKAREWWRDYMKVSRFRPLSPAAAEMWDALGQAWDDAVSRKKSAKQALDEAQQITQRALDEAWAGK